MNSDLNKAANCWGCYDGDDIIAFYAVLHFPHPRKKNIKKGHRLVVLPDYQGIGIGTRFADMVADYYHKLGFDYFRIMSAKNVIAALSKSPLWIARRYSVEKPSASGDKNLAKNPRKVKTASFYYVGKK